MQFKVGDATVTRVVELEATGGSRFILPDATPDEVQKIGWLEPHFADERGRLKIAVQTFVVRTPDVLMLVDTGLGNGKSGRKVPHWNDRTEPFLEKLAEAGAPAADVDLVVNTHLHVDHVGWNTTRQGETWVPTFAKARHIMGRTEFDYWRDQQDDAEHRAVFEDSVRPVDAAGLVDLADPEDEIAPGISLVATPGHSIGHLSLLIRSKGEELLLGGDVMHHPCQIARPDWSSSADYDKSQSAATRRALFDRLAAAGTPLLGGHFTGAGRGRVQRDGDGFRLEIA
ncbi:MBL fold metallo-hydrolase [Chelatococcus reniformis]|uniref:MBL fold metallo-hydrolase n=1 Tax=Chelatococcus reniformis TaxID=1494448 RepID=A0A916U252_9HYPH|nr:MBL fold metallo-hydrolase [Chelatococcus reniformis]GGC57678.1 MBL fold metallo-hydrolase [Chelatococcus reniformis]